MNVSTSLSCWNISHFKWSFTYLNVAAVKDGLVLMAQFYTKRYRAVRLPHRADVVFAVRLKPCKTGGRELKDRRDTVRFHVMTQHKNRTCHLTCVWTHFLWVSLPFASLFLYFSFLSRHHVTSLVWADSSYFNIWYAGQCAVSFKDLCSQNICPSDFNPVRTELLTLNQYLISAGDIIH